MLESCFFFHCCSPERRIDGSQVPTVEQYAMRAFADALEDVPNALAENSGLSAIAHVADAKAAQAEGPHSYRVPTCPFGSFL